MKPTSTARAQALFQLVLHLGQFEIAEGVHHFDHQIDITAGSIVLAGKGAEEPCLLHLGELGQACFQFA